LIVASIAECHRLLLIVKSDAALHIPGTIDGISRRWYR
jgi:hypothetical protein